MYEKSRHRHFTDKEFRCIETYLINKQHYRDLVMLYVLHETGVSFSFLSNLVFGVCPEKQGPFCINLEGREAWLSSSASICLIEYATSRKATSEDPVFTKINSKKKLDSKDIKRLVRRWRHYSH